jgi:transposase InsO family protein
VAKRKPAAVRRWQCSDIGSLWQLDASPHHWFGDQGPLVPLLDIIDDCSRVITGASLYPRETLLAYLDFLPRTFQAYGLPVALYVDYHSFFFHDHPEALTQLGLALKFYGVSLKYAPTPQAKGKIERSHLFWQNRLPALFLVEKVAEISAANALLGMLRTHHNEQEVHREIQMTPCAAWQQAIQEHRSVLRPAPRCPWWPYVWSIRTSMKVGSDGRVPVGAQRLRVELPPHTRVIRCVQPSGTTSFITNTPQPGKLPQIALNWSHHK